MKLIQIAAFTLAMLASPLFAADKVNINEADKATLAESLHNVGPAKAEAIVNYREKHGDFESIEALVEVKGIGLATVEDNRDVMTVGESVQGTQ